MFRVLLFFCLSSYSITGLAQDHFDKIKGVNFVTPHFDDLQLAHIEGIKEVQAEWISVIPEVVVLRSSLAFDFQYRFIGPYETVEGMEKTIRLSQEAGLKIMLKPHIVFQPISDLKNDQEDRTNATEWRGSYVASSEEDWKLLERQYEDYILKCARVAEKYHLELFCIGTELREFAIRRVSFWNKLIRQVKDIYSGPITYSSNWDGYDQIPFWDQMDFIGMNAYFPISNRKNPDALLIKSAWNTIKVDVMALARAQSKPILFTEFGWRNVDYSGKEPWTHNYGNPPSNLNLQYDLYDSFLSCFWKEAWVAGAMCWNWNYVSVDHSDTNFHINNKPAMAVLKRYYSQKDFFFSKD